MVSNATAFKTFLGFIRVTHKSGKSTSKSSSSFCSENTSFFLYNVGLKGAWTMNGWLRAEQAAGFRLLQGGGERQPCIVVLMFNTTWNRKGLHAAPGGCGQLLNGYWSSTDPQGAVLISFPRSGHVSTHHRLSLKTQRMHEFFQQTFLWNHMQIPVQSWKRIPNIHGHLFHCKGPSSSFSFQNTWKIMPWVTASIKLHFFLVYYCWLISWANFPEEHMSIYLHMCQLY